MFAALNLHHIVGHDRYSHGLSFNYAGRKQNYYELRISYRLVAKLIAHDGKRDVKMKSAAKQIARQRIEVLFQKAKSVYHDDPQLSYRYVATARKIAMAVKIPLPSVYKRQVCKSCHVLLVPGDNCRVRVRQKREPHVVITCLGCGCKTRVPLKKKQGENQT